MPSGSNLLRFRRQFSDLTGRRIRSGGSDQAASHRCLRFLEDVSVMSRSATADDVIRGMVSGDTLFLRADFPDGSPFVERS